MPELAHPYYELKDDFELVVASPAGGEAPLDPVSLVFRAERTPVSSSTARIAQRSFNADPDNPQASVEAFKNDDLCTKFLNDESAQKVVKNTVKLSTLSAPDFDAIFYVGGHGPIVDLAIDKDSIKLIQDVSPPPTLPPSLAQPRTPC